MTTPRPLSAKKRARVLQAMADEERDSAGDDVIGLSLWCAQQLYAALLYVEGERDSANGSIKALEAEIRRMNLNIVYPATKAWQQ